MTSQTLRPAPQPLLWAFALLLALQLLVRAAVPPPVAHATDLMPAPSFGAARLLSLDEPVGLAGAFALRLQAFDNQPGISIPFAALDYVVLTGWLELMLALDPDARYPLLMASHLYSQVPDPARQRLMLDFVYRAFRHDPQRRWRWLAHAALVARHRLGDLALALEYARALKAHAGPTVPSWASQMAIFLLEDMGELEAAKIELGALLASGTIHDQQEARFLAQRLAELEAKTSMNRQTR